jgi:MFS family permease
LGEYLAKNMEKPITFNTTLTKKIWVAIILLSFAGQLAWGVENQFFNTFMYSNIIPDPRPIAWMVAASAVTATLTTILMGTLSDRTRSRWGRRKPFILFGYLAWGIMTALYPSASFFKPVGLAIFMAILLDCIMTFFGSTANDSALNAYTTDVTTKENRGRVMSVVQILTWVAILIVYAGAGPIIESMGYYVFFYVIGGLVLLLGFIGSFFIREHPDAEKPQGTYLHQLFDSFQWKNLVANRNFFMLMIAISLWELALNIFFPYIIIYLQHYLSFDITSSSIAIAVIILIGGIALAWPFGLLVDRWGRKPISVAAIVVEMVGLILFSLTKSMVPLIITGILWLAPFTAWTIATSTWSKDLFPDDRRGQFAGFYLFFWVMLPMILGPLTGGWLSSTYGVKTVIDGQAAIIPSPILFQVAGVATLLALIPLYWVKETNPQGQQDPVVEEIA